MTKLLWMTDLHTGITRLVLPGNARDMHARWSPDGRRFAVASDRSGRSSETSPGARMGKLSPTARSKRWAKEGGTRQVWSSARALTSSATDASSVSSGSSG